ncbi:hypothetical protein HU200_031073 [Digitaria exilis]|uniref:Gag1-like clamp domain-containing protein n=1 Tax=Digitaria exilis TaxID=1010633 RepID=A0A835ET75_9POAL|nr:hypothetical protein HU200_031073 [Digitaria exilis]
MATTRGVGGSASRVGDGDVDLRDRWDWGAIPRFLSSACLFVCSGWVAASLTFPFAPPSEQSRGCFGCCDKAVKQLGELSRNLITHDQIPIAEPFWSTTTIEVEPSDLRGSFINTSNWGFDQHGTGSSHNLPELGNNGLALWEQTRQEWTEIRSLRPKVKQVREPVLRYARTKWPFNMQKNPTKLCHITFSVNEEMVDFLVDIWEQEGLYD